MPSTEVLQSIHSAGSEKTRRFYDQIGWKTQGGRTVDVQMFGVTEVGPIREKTHALRIERIRHALAKAGGDLQLIEVGCGAAPSLFLADLCRHFTAIDFSETGIQQAESKLAAASIAHETRTADACDLPYHDGIFDAAFSSHMLYHIPDSEAQAQAIAEVFRVLRPGGTAVFVLANPWPLLFPIRMIRRMLATIPGISAALNWLRKRPPLPYQPMSIHWTRRQFRKFGDAHVMVYAIPSVWFLQNVTEQRGVRRLLWKTISWLERRMPVLSAYLGNFFIAAAIKSD